ncbi:MAG: TlpA family protein disulfide reductase [Candidatus Eremiobacteraeota bacterium]|nr:TlpA family protein disulfide reductase [Candidatus Eremiobacteraeota bacterium]
MPALAIPHTGDVAPGFSLPAARGGTVTVRTFSGKPTYLNFFASWCGPCNTEAPSVGRFYRTYHKRGLSILAIDEQESPSKGSEFARRYGWSFPVVVDDGSARASYRVIVLPVHVFIDRSGKISTYRIGEMELNEIEDAIRKIV